MLLLITGSIDGTADLLVSRLSGQVFRLNYDRWHQYDFRYSPGGWSIRNPAGLTISSETATRCLWWKAFAYSTQHDRMIKEEVKYVLRDLYGWFSSRELAKGNSPYLHHSLGKINILSFAQDFFPIPATAFSIGLKSLDDIGEQPLVTKSLSSEVSSEGKVLLTTEIPGLDVLDPSYPWFLQSRVDSDWDVTVFQCGDRVFSFRRSREGMEGIDWRSTQDFTGRTEEWLPFELESSDREKLLALSVRLGVDFGRYDFMISLDGELVFLEFNANGQWVFLDFQDKFGVADAVVEYLDV